VLHSLKGLHLAAGSRDAWCLVLAVTVGVQVGGLMGRRTALPGDKPIRAMLGRKAGCAVLG